MAIPTPKIPLAVPLLVFLVATLLAGLLACASESSNLGQYEKGRTLHFSVVSVERTPELRYSTCDVLATDDDSQQAIAAEIRGPMDVVESDLRAMVGVTFVGIHSKEGDNTLIYVIHASIEERLEERVSDLAKEKGWSLIGTTRCDPAGTWRDWSITPSAEGLELVLVRARVENHTAVSAILHVDRTGAELRDVANTVYRPISIGDSAWRDFRGASEAVVRMDAGECFDGPRTLIDAGAAVRWQSEAEGVQYIDFENAAVVGIPQGRAEIAPGASVSRTIDEAGTYPYVCGSPGASEWPAELWAADPEVTYDYIKRTTAFLQGSFELLQGHGLDGFLIFEAPIGTEFRDVRWRAGDSITFGF